MTYFMFWIELVYLTILLCYKDIQVIYRFLFTILSRDIENTFHLPSDGLKLW